ncbi:MAG TPA: SDR family oxidoreductase [Candidatus Limnocylindrales bacterium]|nr:SDR family oxidoreductase [Candidatus Limnocylindrales bacterium]
MKSGLRGRVALITGSNHGIGAAIARALAADGTHVFVTFFRPPPTTADQAINGGQYVRDRAQNADSVLAQCRALDVKAAALETDLSNPTSIVPLFDTCEAALGPVEILVHNASAWQADTFAPPALRDAQTWPPPDLMHLINAESIDLHYAVNTRATALLIGEFARRHTMRGADWGRIVTLTTGGADGFPGEVSYGASKAALESYTRAAARELGPFGITANVVCPGPTQTGWIEPAFETELISQTPLRRIGQPNDVAGSVVLLCSDQAAWLTGQRIMADGGYGV